MIFYIFGKKNFYVMIWIWKSKENRSRTDVENYKHGNSKKLWRSL